MNGGLGLVVLTALLIVLVILWGLFGPRRRSDESGHHVELARRTRERDAGCRHHQQSASPDDEKDDDRS